MAAHLARNLAISALREVIVFVRSAKNDFEGIGNKIAFRVRELSPSAPFYIASDMFRFNAMAQPRADHLFLSYRDQWCY